MEDVDGSVPAAAVDSEKEIDIAMKVLNKVMTSTGKGDLISNGEDSALPPSNELTTTTEKATVKRKPKWPGKTELTEHAKMQEQRGLQRTVFISTSHLILIMKRLSIGSLSLGKCSHFYL